MLGQGSGVSSTDSFYLLSPVETVSSPERQHRGGERGELQILSKTVNTEDFYQYIVLSGSPFFFFQFKYITRQNLTGNIKPGPI